MEDMLSHTVIEFSQEFIGRSTHLKIEQKSHCPYLKLRGDNIKKQTNKQNIFTMRCLRKHFKCWGKKTKH